MSNKSSLKDDNIIKLILSNNQDEKIEGLTKAHDKYALEVYKYILTLKKDVEDTKDIIQETFAELWLKSKNDKIVYISNLKGFLIGIAKIKCFKKWKDEKKLKEAIAMFNLQMGLEYTLDFNNSFDIIKNIRDTFSIFLDKCIEEDTSVSCKKVIYEYYILGKPLKEILPCETDSEKNTAKQKLFYCRKRTLKCIQEKIKKAS